MPWFVTDSLLLLMFAVGHSLGTTATAKKWIEKLTGGRGFLWNFLYNLVTFASLGLVIYFWKGSETVLWRVEGSWYWAMWGFNLFFVASFFYLFKFTQPFGEWLGVTQVSRWAKGEGEPTLEGYKIKTMGIKRYIRFPHHTCLIFIFWCLPVMTADLALLASIMTIYAYVGSVHQDLRGYSYFPEQWSEYRKESRILFPAPELVIRDIKEALAVRRLRRKTPASPMLVTQPKEVD